MTRIIDRQRRLVLPRQFKSGDVVTLETEGADTLIVRRMKTVKKTRPKFKLMKLKDGSTVIVGGPPTTREMVQAALEDFP